ncbi:hypothetical protein [Novosphingopyxis sp. YJ-S2-01]|uniref:hypothetical protein n=1 Tax=Novosphingopyxis sp. YJ-S2-01 TaxID=2794021 RepID=UPI0018DD182C|nr:hypothetical protein [Novosphingopyxis sp. YJ-S2-01]MBH9537806.1 hypothetical protein [Novosphingopyxis sp. YJ-S2-01]
MIDKEDSRSGLKRGLWILASCLALIFLLGIGAGFLSAHLEHGGGSPGTAGYAVLAAVLVLIAGAVVLLVRSLNPGNGEAPATRKERLNRNVLIASGALGGLIAAALIASGGADAVFAGGPLPSGIALALAAIVAILLPALSYYWHRYAVDEQEMEAYKQGALAGIYVYMIGAPTWWLLSRGGWVPEVNGIALYLITVFTVGGVWIWQKYR